MSKQNQNSCYFLQFRNVHQLYSMSVCVVHITLMRDHTL